MWVSQMTSSRRRNNKRAIIIVQLDSPGMLDWSQWSSTCFTNMLNRWLIWNKKQSASAGRQRGVSGAGRRQETGNEAVAASSSA